MEHTQDQLTNIETKLAFLEDFIDKLQDTAVEHTDSIERLKQENRALKTKIGNIADAVQEMPHVRPPHY